MKTIHVVGCDQSLTHTAIHRAKVDFGARLIAFFGEPSSIRGELSKFSSALERLDAMEAAFTAKLRQSEPGLLVIEGYSFGSRDSHAHSLGELGGAFRLAAYRLGWSVLAVPPSTLKKFVSGRGDTKKDGMRMEVLAKLGYTSTDDNDADARALVCFGIEWLRWKHEPNAVILKRHVELFEAGSSSKKKGKRAVPPSLVEIPGKSS